MIYFQAYLAVLIFLSLNPKLACLLGISLGRASC